jgi:predicted alpha-1,6-mannanase (GH76 family)
MDLVQEKRNDQHTKQVNNGLDLTTCGNDNGTVWSYNQGVILGGLVELSRALPDDSSYLRSANDIATAALKVLTDLNGILHDPCEPNCGADCPQFKGIFV